MSNSNDKIDLNEFIQIKPIGKGSFGIVFLIKKIETGKLYAAKVLNLQINSISKEEIISLSHEVNISAGINHLIHVKSLKSKITSTWQAKLFKKLT